MKRLTTALNLLMLLALTNGIQAQQFSWGTTAKIKNNFYQYSLGETPSGGSVLLLSKYSIRKDFRQNEYNRHFEWKSDNEITLVQFDKQQNVKSTNPFTFKNEVSVFYTAHITDKMYFLYSSIQNNKCILFADVYSLDEKYVGTEELRALSKYNSGQANVNSNYTVVSSSNHEYTAVQGIDNLITFYDAQMKKIWEQKFDYKFLTDMEIKDDGEAFAIGGTDKSATLLAFSLKKKQLRTSELSLDPKYSVQDFRVTADQKQSIAYVTYAYGAPGDKVQFYFGPMRNIEFWATGIVAEAYDLTKLTPKRTAMIPFSNETLMKVSGKKKVEKLRGLEWFSTKNLHITENGELIVVLEKEYTEALTTRDQYQRVIKVEYSTVDEDIMCIRVKSDGTSLQSVIKREAKGQSVYDYMLSCATFYEKGKLYVMYNEGGFSYRLKINELSGDLVESPQTEIKTYKEHDVYLSIRHAQKMKDGNYKVYGREGKNTASVIIKF